MRLICKVGQIDRFFMPHDIELVQLILNDGRTNSIVQYPQLFDHIAHIFVLANDIDARGLTLSNYQHLSLSDFIKVTEKFYPHLAL